MTDLKVWIEISKSALKNNIQIFRSHLKENVKLYSVVKSNAYGHGLYDFSPLAESFGLDGFCVDSVLEGVTLRKHGITKPILVLGPTLANLFTKAKENNITLSISNEDSLEELKNSPDKPDFHLKIDTGMHRQGFFVAELPRTLKLIKENNLPVKGIFSHLANAKDPDDQKYNKKQLTVFLRAIEKAKEGGYENIKKHLLGSNSLFLEDKYQFDLIRSGASLYGVFPSEKLKKTFSSINLRPVLSLYATISELKELPKDSYIGYELKEKLIRNSKLAIIPIGYWHGFPRALSQKGEVLINGKRARVIGIVSMDIITVDVTNIDCKVGDKVTIIGTDQSDTILAGDLARLASTTPHEILTRLNPLIKRSIVQ